MSKLMEFFKKFSWLFDILIVVGALYWFIYMPVTKENPILKEYKDGIQNHLVFDTRGQCFFVRPNDDITVYLVRVTDCDKK